MKQSLQLRLGQQLTMTPQLQQAIRLLQLSTLELRTEIQQALESNLMLEVEEEEGEAAAEEPGPEAADGGSEDVIPEELPVDSSWEDIYDGATPYSDPGPEAATRDPYENRAASGGSLREHLLWQAQLAGFSDRDHVIAEAVIDAVGDDGYLTVSLEELASTFPPEWELEADEIEAVRARILRFDPVGVAACDVREALAVQLDQLPPDTPWLEPARRLVDAHLDLLVNRQHAQLARALEVDEERLCEVVDLIRSLDPRPGSRVNDDAAEYITPDVIVRRDQGRWVVELNPETAPRLRVNSYYASLVRRADSSETNTCLRSHLQEARWFIKSLRSRNETLLKVARAIVERQQGFFEHGDEAMEPLVLREVAEAVEMHESTISRITTQKYMYTPRGTFEFKYFFSSHVQTSDGGECSATAIRARIRRLIAEEDTSRPLSDSKIARMLQNEGIEVARRTVAKYRESMAIASSAERKRLG